ncbi:phosphomannomutase/phosphoglucomutase [Amphritea sp. 1_MG-2023]|uniref:phosphomannomutase/phosphoglucomutase n=1 Tax=Amphritea sp. 1_MG-2023 TaxID=3062670 RepID=UPI0026E1EAD1|nr:phosphomannomutase/phosphoglucomutase [Amphritea sp. 1_MG-2023]MDO6562742.1 phosphomannomutase/phosphoglucomutase [Amphritea sp. 1_MG-2023]
MKQQELNPAIFRAYDIRGIYPDSLNRYSSALIGQAIGSEAQARQQTRICVGYDGRLSSPTLHQALITGLLRSGIDVIDLGMIPTPALYFATHALQTGSGVIITGSHNPANYNGFKIMLAGHTLSGDEISGLYQRCIADQLTSGNGTYQQQTIDDAYLSRLLQGRQLHRPLKVVVDCGNGVPGPLIVKLLQQFGCDVEPLYCEVDGHFPHHHPNPEKPENLVDLIAGVRQSQADIGLALDGDGDRLAVISNQGDIITPDQLICLFIEDLLQRHIGAKIVYDVKCSLNIGLLIKQLGGQADMWRCGHSMIKNRMQENGALFGGEFSGHLFFAEQWYGFDDGLYAAIRLLELLSRSNGSAAELFDPFPILPATPMINIAISDSDKFSLIDTLKQTDFAPASVCDIDGLRVEYSDGWFGIRPSNTTPMLTLRIEALTVTALQRISETVMQTLNPLIPDLQIPELAVTNYTNPTDRDNTHATVT